MDILDPGFCLSHPNNDLLARGEVLTSVPIDPLHRQGARVLSEDLERMDTLY